jgi:hypothetical protein
MGKLAVELVLPTVRGSVPDATLALEAFKML